jgi:hypothetical protein
VSVFREAARILTVASTLSYATENEAKRQLTTHAPSRSARLLPLEAQEGKSAQAMLFTYVGTSSSTTDAARARPIAILAFRGTELPDDEKEGIREFYPDWLHNLRSLTPIEDPDGWVAKSFHEAWQGSPHGTKGLKADFLKEIHAFSIVCGGKTLDMFVTGHSTGGALAQVSLLDLAQAQESDDNSFSLPGCITLAQPRFCDDTYAKKVTEAMKNIPRDMLANEDGTGIDPVVSVGGTWSVVPPGRLWKVRVGEILTSPLGKTEAERAAHAPLPVFGRRIAMSLPLHWPGGRVGYLVALEK